MSVQIFLSYSVYVSFGYIHMVVLSLIFWRSPILFSIVTVTVYISTNSTQGFPFLNIWQLKPWGSLLRTKTRKEGERWRRREPGTTHGWELILGQSHRLFYFAAHWDSLSGFLWILRGTIWKFSQRTALAWGLQGLCGCLSLRGHLASKVRSKVMWLPLVFLFCYFRISERLFLITLCFIIWNMYPKSLLKRDI